MSVEDLLKCGQVLSAHGSIHTAPMSPLVPKPGISEADQLRQKSEYLMKVLSKPDHGTCPPGLSSREQQARPPPNTEQLEEMTAQVRRLLNL